MFNMNKKVLGAVGITAIGLASVGASVTQAANPNQAQNSQFAKMRQFFHANLSEEQKTEFKKQHEDMRTEMQSHHTAMQAVFESGDYEAWKALVEERHANRPEGAPELKVNMLDIITAENFDQFAQMHALMQAGDRDGAEAIAEELGLPEKLQGRHMRGNMMGGKGNFMGKFKTQVSGEVEA
jgi:hypothetical protein